MKARNLTTVAATVACALMITFGSANRAEAHRGWGWGIGAGIATALILGAIYRHHYRPYYYGYPYYGYGYYRPVYRRYYAGYYGLAGITTTIATTGTSIAIAVIGDDN